MSTRHVFTALLDLSERREGKGWWVRLGNCATVVPTSLHSDLLQLKKYCPDDTPLSLWWCEINIFITSLLQIWTKSNSPTRSLEGSVANNLSQDEQRTTTTKKTTGKNEVNGKRAHCQATGLENSAEQNFNIQIKIHKSLQIHFFFCDCNILPSSSMPRSLFSLLRLSRSVGHAGIRQNWCEIKR